MRSHKYLPHYTVADYHLWEGDWELIDGLAYAMTPSPNLRHQNIAGEVHTEIRLQLRKAKDSCGTCTVVNDLDWHVNNTTVLRPDIAVICDEKGNFISKPPQLIVEVLSKATAFKDRNLKYEIYEEQGVPYYIIIDPETKQFNIFVLQNGRYEENNDCVAFTINSHCSIDIKLVEVIASV